MKPVARTCITAASFSACLVLLLPSMTAAQVGAPTGWCYCALTGETKRCSECPATGGGGGDDDVDSRALERWGERIGEQINRGIRNLFNPDWWTGKKQQDAARATNQQRALALNEEAARLDGPANRARKLQLFEEAARLWPDNPVIAANVASVHAFQAHDAGNDVEALRLMRIALSLHPGNDITRENVAYLEAQVAEQQSRERTADQARVAATSEVANVTSAWAARQSSPSELEGVATTGPFGTRQITPTVAPPPVRPEGGDNTSAMTQLPSVQAHSAISGDRSTSREGARAHSSLGLDTAGENSGTLRGFTPSPRPVAADALAAAAPPAAMHDREFTKELARYRQLEINKQAAMRQLAQLERNGASGSDATTTAVTRDIRAQIAEFEGMQTKAKEAMDKRLVDLSVGWNEAPAPGPASANPASTNTAATVSPN